jgi:hypothetical protein
MGMGDAGFGAACVGRMSGEQKRVSGYVSGCVSGYGWQGGAQSMFVPQDESCTSRIFRASKKVELLEGSPTPSPPPRRPRKETRSPSFQPHMFAAPALYPKTPLTTLFRGATLPTWLLWSPHAE